MSFVVKLSLGMYVASVLIFSSWSKADMSSLSFASSHPKAFHSSSAPKLPLMTSVNGTGHVFVDDNGFLFFQSEQGTVCLIHQNSFAFFDEVELPAKVKVQGMSMARMNQPWSMNQLLQINSVSFLNL